MSGEIRESFEKWLENSRNINPRCGCDYRGAWHSCSYHEGCEDGWEAGRESGLRLAAEWIKGAPCLEALSPDFIAANLLALIPSEKDTQK